MVVAVEAATAVEVWYTCCMPSDFDFEDVDLNPTPAAKPEVPAPPAPVQLEVGGSPDETPQEESEEIDELSARLLKSQHYWAVVNSDSIGDMDPNSPLADEVMQEVRDFARERLMQLMGAAPTKKRGRPSKVKPMPKQPVKPVKFATKLPAIPRSKTATQKASVTPATASDTGQEILRIIECEDGTKLTKAYRKLIDKESGKEYYMGYDVDRSGNRVPDGQRYKLETNAAGAQFFRVFNQQTVLNAPQKLGKEQYEALFASQAQEAASKTLSAMRNSRDPMAKLFAAAVDISQRS